MAERPASALPETETENRHKVAEGLTANDSRGLKAANEPILASMDGIQSQSDKEDLGARTEELDTRRAILEKGERKIAEQEKEVALRETQVVRREVELEKRKVEISRREYDAEQGFLAKQKEMYHALVQDCEKLRSEMTEERKIRDARLRERAKTLDDREERLAKKQRDLDSEKRLLTYEELHLNELQDDIEERVKQLAAACIEKLEHQLQSVNEQLEQARSDRDKCDKRLQQRQEADRKFGHRTPEKILQDLELLRQQNKKLHDQLAELPDADAIVRLVALEKEQETWQAERIALLQQKSDLNRRLAYVNNDINEREVQRDIIEALKSRQKVLFKANEELRSENDHLFNNAESRIPFPACISMDSNTAFQLPMPMSRGMGDLKDFVQDLQHRIASKGLYYSLPDLRSFVGGIAMGRLIILQGVSGTGKTSLPVEFAYAVGTEPAVIEVQAGWRDPQDLVGHYNSFEKKFDEKKFLQALYKAGTPQWQDAIHIVLLDEMNLSHPEQYFSDLLSIMEFPPEAQRLVLMSHAVDSAPQQFIEGSKLPIPRNVWFVGTANHDETTMAFAPKTYDRSHVMELPLNPEIFPIEQTPPREPLSCKALQRAFEAAVKDFSSHADNAIQFLEDGLRELLANNFEVGWGPRLTKQMHRYVPVVIAAGGTVGEATDQVLALRILRKLKDRHSNQPEHLVELRQKIKGSWRHLDRQFDPDHSHSIKLLNSELKRMDHDPEDGL